MKQLFIYLRKIPFFGPLVDTSRRDHVEAMSELTTTLIFSTFPFWLGSIVIYAMNETPNKNYFSVLLSTISQGELLIFSTSLLAPFFYMALHDPIGSRAFPGRLIHALPVVVIIMLCTGFFSLSRTKAWVDQNFVFEVSIYLTLFSLVLIYLAMVYHKERQRSPGEIMRETQVRFSEDFAKHRK